MLGLLRRYLKLGSRPRERPEQGKLEQQVEELQSVVSSIAASLDAISQDLAGQAFDIHIDKVCIDKVHLDQLVFNIDGIGVRELSGSLSIGINYGGKVIRMIPSPAPGGEQPKTPLAKKPCPPAGGQPRINFHAGPKEGEVNDQAT